MGVCLCVGGERRYAVKRTLLSRITSMLVSLLRRGISFVEQETEEDFKLR